MHCANNTHTFQTAGSFSHDHGVDPKLNDSFSCSALHWRRLNASANIYKPPTNSHERTIQYSRRAVLKCVAVLHASVWEITRVKPSGLITSRPVNCFYDLITIACFRNRSCYLIAPTPGKVCRFDFIRFCARQAGLDIFVLILRLMMY